MCDTVTQMTNRTLYPHLEWTELDRRIVLETTVFDMVASTRRAEDGREGTYYLMDAPDWCNVVALTTDERGRECFVMVRQFRHGSMRVCLEFPGGVVDRGEEPLTAAARELEEETGYAAQSLTLIGSVNPNPALMGNRCFTYLAHGVHRHGRRELDEGEIIDVELIPVDELVAGVYRDEFDHAMMIVALGFYQTHRLTG